jgi:hypothetical protein
MKELDYDLIEKIGADRLQDASGIGEAMESCTSDLDRELDKEYLKTYRAVLRELWELE